MEGAAYHHLYLHRTMLLDQVRCETYRRAIRETVKPGDVVLDAGAGTGLLSLFAAQAGAKKVYAIELTKMAEVARQLVVENKASDCIEVIQGDMESVELPEKVDVIVSEWLGCYGVDENLLAPLLVARDRYLKPGGKMLPSHVTAWMAPVWDSEFESALHFWRSYPYQVDLSLIANNTVQEWFWTQHHITEDTILAEPQQMWRHDIGNCSLEEARSPFQAELLFPASRSGKLSALAGWFSAEFGAGITLTNAPDAPKTHWGRCVFPLERTLEVEPGIEIAVKFACAPANRGYTYNKWRVRVGDAPWEDHDSTQALW